MPAEPQAYIGPPDVTLWVVFSEFQSGWQLHAVMRDKPTPAQVAMYAEVSRAPYEDGYLGTAARPVQLDVPQREPADRTDWVVVSPLPH